MQSLFIFVALFAALAGRVLSFDIPIGDKVFTTSTILAIPDSPVKAACAANCTTASSQIAACNDDTACLCRNETFMSVLNCETCMFHYLIATNKPAPDPRVGSNVVMGGYVAGCATANPAMAKAKTALQVPAGWDGSVVSVFPVAGAAVTVVLGAMLGVTCILLVSNM